MTPLDEARPVVITAQETAGLLYSSWADDNFHSTEQSHLAPLKKLEMGFSCVVVLKIENDDGIIKNRLSGLGLLIASGL